MKPGTRKFVEQANLVLSRAEIMLTVGLNEDAAQAAYMACFHLAQTYIFERADKISKSHKGVQIEFFRLTRDDPRVVDELRRFLALAYDYKSIADYFTGAEATTSMQEAEIAILTARRFISHFGGLIAEPRKE